MSKSPALLGRSFASQTISWGVIMVITRLRGLITYPILSRLIGTHGYGILAALIALSDAISSLILLGSSTAMTVFIPAQTPDRRRRDFWAIAQLTAVFGLLVFLMLVMLYPYVRKALLPSEITLQFFIAGMALIPINALRQVFHAQIVNNQQGHTFSKVTALTSLLDVVLLIAGAYWFGIVGVLYAMVISLVVLCGCMAWLICQHDRFVLLSPHFIPELGRYYTYGLIMVVAGLSSWAINSSDRLIIGKYLPVNILGIYQVAYGLCTQLNELGTPVFAPLMPFVVANLGTGNIEGARYYLQQSLKVLLFIFVPAVILFSITASDLIILLTSPDFVLGASIVPFVAAGIALWQIGGVFAYTLHAHQRGYLLVVASGCAAIVNISLNLIFVPSFGIMAAAVSTLVAYLLHFLLTWFFSRQSLLVGLDIRFGVKLSVASAAMMAVTSGVYSAMMEVSPASRFLTSALPGGFIYLTMMFLMRVLTIEDVKQLLMAVRASYLPDERK